MSLIDKYGNVVITCKPIIGGTGTTHYYECSLCHRPIDYTDYCCKNCGARITHDAE